MVASKFSVRTALGRSDEMTMGTLHLSSPRLQASDVQLRSRLEVAAGVCVVLKALSRLRHPVKEFFPGAKALPARLVSLERALYGAGRVGGVLVLGRVVASYHIGRTMHQHDLKLQKTRWAHPHIPKRRALILQHRQTRMTTLRIILRPKDANQPGVRTCKDTIVTR